MNTNNSAFILSFSLCFMWLNSACRLKAFDWRQAIEDRFFAPLRNLQGKAGADAAAGVVDVAEAEVAIGGHEPREAGIVGVRRTGPIDTETIIAICPVGFGPVGDLALPRCVVCEIRLVHIILIADEIDFRSPHIISRSSPKGGLSKFFSNSLTRIPFKRPAETSPSAKKSIKKFVWNLSNLL